MPQFLASVLTIIIVAAVILTGVAYCILLERKIASWVQDRIGPNRVGFSFGLDFMPKFHFWGLGQPLADGLKMLLKEDYTPPGVDRPLFLLAPVLAIVPAMLAWAVIPWGGELRWGDQTLSITGAPIDIGVIYIITIGAVAVYGVVVGGYASNNKYAFLGGLRAAAQMLSYEVPLGLMVLIIILLTGSARADAILGGQTHGPWNICFMPLAAVIFFICNLAETNRAPFDLPEAEQELVGGYHTEYSSMKLAMFLLGEYMHMVTAGAFFSLLFLGGWDVPFIHLPAAAPGLAGLGLVVLKFAVFAVKVFFLISLMMLVRWTLPRFRFDQLMRLAWRGLIPIAILLLLWASAVVFAGVEGWLGPRPIGGGLPAAAKWWLLGGNVAIALCTLLIAPLIPQGADGNRRIPLPGSRFSPPPAAA